MSDDIVPRFFFCLSERLLQHGDDGGLGFERFAPAAGELQLFKKVLAHVVSPRALERARRIMVRKVRSASSSLSAALFSARSDG